MLSTLWNYVMAPAKGVEDDLLRSRPSNLEAQPPVGLLAEGSSSSSGSDGEDEERSYSSSSSFSASSSSSSSLSSEEEEEEEGKKGGGGAFHGRRRIKILKVLDEQAQVYVFGHASLKAFILTRRDSVMFKNVLMAAETVHAYAHSLRPLWMPLEKLRLLSDRRWESVANHSFDVLLLYRLFWAQERGTLKSLVLPGVLRHAHQAEAPQRPAILLPVKATATSEPSPSFGAGNTMRRAQPQQHYYEEATVIDLGKDDDSTVDKELKTRKARERQKKILESGGGDDDESEAMKRWNELPPAKQRLLYEAYRRTGTGKRRVTQLGGVFDSGSSEPLPDDGDDDELFNFDLPASIRTFFEEKKREEQQRRKEHKRSWASRRVRRILEQYSDTLTEPLDDMVTWFLQESERLAAEEGEWAVVDLVAGSFCSSSSSLI